MLVSMSAKLVFKHWHLQALCGAVWPICPKLKWYIACYYVFEVIAICYQFGRQMC